MSCRTRISFLTRSAFNNFRYLSYAQREERNALLKEIYTPSFSQFEKGSKEYLNLCKSGKVWENYFRPFESKFRAKGHDYESIKDYERKCDFLEEMSIIKDTINISTNDLLQRMIVSFSHQSCAIEGNSLGIEESQTIWERMNQDYNIDDLLKNEGAQFPIPESLLDKPESEIDIIEIRNHLLSTYFLFNNTELKSKTEINIDNIKKIHCILLRDIPQANFSVWGKIQKAGKFRTVSMQAMGYHLTIYPYGEEIPTLMEKFVQFYNKNVVINNDLDDENYNNPLISSCHILSTFLHIHPFYDGNGRVGRSLMALYLSHAGYPPPVFQQLDRKVYFDALYKAQAQKDPIPLYNLIIGTIYDILALHSCFPLK
ncbi:3427_t:CDS:2 [Diversispora eburnea]|uniref:3427_t:CDS:1 n=1 Tax=Diversispora eburnea TaxID=1213867 RepID=A0A9N8VQ75_9GLOM|nr:3427_t:CDS:2 [Diversispora eburnea]